MKEIRNFPHDENKFFNSYFFLFCLIFWVSSNVLLIVIRSFWSILLPEKNIAFNVLEEAEDEKFKRLLERVLDGFFRFCGISPKMLQKCDFYSFSCKNTCYFNRHFYFQRFENRLHLLQKNDIYE